MAFILRISCQSDGEFNEKTACIKLGIILAISPRISLMECMKGFEQYLGNEGAWLVHLVHEYKRFLIGRNVLMSGKPERETRIACPPREFLRARA